MNTEALNDVSHSHVSLILSIYTPPTPVILSASFSAETSVTSPRKLFIFNIFHKLSLINVSKTKRKEMNTEALNDISQFHASLILSIVVGGRHCWLFFVWCGQLNMYYIFLIYHVHSLCIYTAIYIFSGLPAMTKGCLSTICLAVEQNANLHA